MAGGALTSEATALLRWGRRVRRDLPWRHSRDPWEVLVSEVMLQQTGVARVLPRWERFLRRWPDTASCSAAPLGEVLVEWEGLGYPRRARALHTTACIVERDHGGAFPDALQDLLALPGVGPYTARAVLAFAFEADAAVVDTNVGRVLARHGGRRLTAREAQAAADDWLPAGSSWEWNQALLDLGATVCRPSVPDCGACPVASGCAWWGAGLAPPDPADGSAGVSRPQARYQGSARQRRGRVLAALGAGAPVPDDCRDVVDSLVADGLVEDDGAGGLRLPGAGGLRARGSPGSAG